MGELTETRNAVGVQWFESKQSADVTDSNTDLVELDPELSSALQWRGEGVEVLTPEGKELLDAKAPQRVVPSVTDAVLLPHRHHLVVHMQCILKVVDKHNGIRIQSDVSLTGMISPIPHLKSVPV